MSLKVLLADDNITAQRMGSKILTDAGYNVLAVSNGAAAVKKIAAEKPDILILDVYMPGYDGLEVCTKVKQDPTTSATPVILTVTNMEPFNQADGNRAGADGLMIKPFEATDLLAVIKKFEARVVKAAPVPEPGYPPTAEMEAVQEFHDASYEEWKSEAMEDTEPAKMEVPHEMAATPALGMEEFAAHPLPAEEESVAAFAVEAAYPPMEPVRDAAFPISDDVMAALGGEQPYGSEMVAPPHAECALVPEAVPAAAPVPEFEPTSAPQAGEVQVTPAAEYETTIQETPAITEIRDADLVTNAEDLTEFITQFGVEGGEEVPVGIAMPEESAPEPDNVEAVAEPEAEVAAEEAQGYELPAAAEPEVVAQETQAYEMPVAAEAEVAARETQAYEMPAAPEAEVVAEEAQAYEPPVEAEAEATEEGISTQELEPYELPDGGQDSAAAIEAAPELAAEVAPEPAAEAELEAAAPVEEAFAYAAPEEKTEAVEAPPAEEVESEMQRAYAVSGSAAAAAPALADETELIAESATPQAADELVARFAAELDQAHREHEAMGEAAPIAEEAAPAELQTGAVEIPQLDSEKVAAAVARVLERYKSELIESIVRELKN